MHALSGPGHHLSYLDQCQNDMGLMAMHYGWVQTVNNALHCVLSPIVGSLSDTWGRRKLHAIGRVGPMLWFLGLPVMTMWYSAYPDDARIRRLSLHFRFLLEAIPWGTITAGNWGVFSAAHTDLFASRPELSSRIQAAEHSWRSAFGIPCSLFGAFAVPALWTTRYRYVPWLLSAAVAASQIVVALRMPETLPEERRKPFSLKQANPLSNVMLLMRNGRGLRGLACAGTCFFASQSTWSIQAMYRLGPLNWTPGENSYFHAVEDLAVSASNARCANRPPAVSLRSASEASPLCRQDRHPVHEGQGQPQGV